MTRYRVQWTLEVEATDPAAAVAAIGQIAGSPDRAAQKLRIEVREARGVSSWGPPIVVTP